MSQAALAKKVGVSQSRIAQIESGVGTAKITFDVLFGVLSALGFTVKVHLRRQLNAITKPTPDSPVDFKLTQVKTL